MSAENRVAIVRNGVVDHIEIVRPGYVAPPGAKAIPSLTANIGDTYDGEKFSQPTPPNDPAYVEGRVYTLLTGQLRAVYNFDVGASVIAQSDILPHTRTDLADLAEWGRENPTSLRSWLGPSGDRISMTGMQFVSLYQSVSTANLDLYEAADKLVDGINASPRTVFDEDDILAGFRAVGLKTA